MKFLKNRCSFPLPSVSFPFRGYLLLSFFLFGAWGCDYNRIYEEYRPIEEHVWHYDQPVQFEAAIEDTTDRYNLFLDLRHKNNYPYNNIWVTVTTITPDADTNRLKNEFSLANERGQWKGQAVGSVYDHRFRILKNMRFKQKGNYQFRVKHLMRKDELKGVMDVGLRIERMRE